MDLSKYYDQMTPLPVENIKYLIVHHSATSPNLTIEDIHQMHLNNGWLCVGYHAIILRDGTIQYGRPMDSQGAHAQGFNNCSLELMVLAFVLFPTLLEFWTKYTADRQSGGILESLFIDVFPTSLLLSVLAIAGYIAYKAFSNYRK